MNCRKCERLISDSLDGRLSESVARDLDAHLAGCAFCRAYRARLDRIQKEAAALGETRVPAGYWDDFSARLSARLEPAVSPERRGRFPLRGWRWAWLAVPAAAAGLVVFLLVFRPNPASVADHFGSEERLDAASLASLEGTELAGHLDEVIRAAIQEETGFLSADELPAYADDPIFWDNLTDDEVALLDREIAKELKS